MRLVMVVPRFPQLSETFIVNKFVGLVDAGWDVHVVCQQAALDSWDLFPPLQTRPELKSRVHAEWNRSSSFGAALMWLPAFISTLTRSPRLTWRYWREVWSRVGLGTFKQFYLDTTLVSLAPDILHFEFGALARGRTHLRQALDCCLTASFRGSDVTYAGLENPDHYADLWADADALHLLADDLWRRALSRGCPPDMPHVFIPPAIDVTFFQTDDAAREAVTIGPDRPLRILSVGRLEWVKGYEYALEAVHLLRERNVPFEYHIVGAGHYLQPLAFARHQLGLEDEVTFLGGLPHSDVVEEMKWADVFLHAAVTEGFGNSVLEAQAMQLPVVASDADGLKANVADGETGIIVPRRDPAALADKLALLASKPDLRRRMGDAGRRRVMQCFQLDDQIAAFDAFYRSMEGCHDH